LCFSICSPAERPIASANRLARWETCDPKIGHLHPSPTFGKVSLMDRLGLSQMVLKRFLKQFREHRYPVFRSFAVTDMDFIAGKINVLYAQLKEIAFPWKGKNGNTKMKKNANFFPYFPFTNQSSCRFSGTRKR